MKIFNKNEWKKVKLGDVCEVITGNTPLKKIKEYWDKDEVPFITPPELKYEGINYITPNIYVSKIGAKQGRIIPKNSICVCCIGSLGKLGILKEDAITNQQINSLILKDKNVDLLYLYFYLKTIKNNLESIASSTTVKIINKSSFEKIDINLPSLEIQKKISKKLELLENNINFRKSQLNSLNELSKSLFTTMFGDIEKKSEYHKLSNICDVRDGTHDSPEYITTDKRFPLITSKNLKGDKIDFSEVNFISEADFNKINVRSKVDIGDILMPMIGTIGNPIIVKIDKKFSIKNLALIKFKNSQIINTFLKFLLLSDYFNLIISQKNKGGTQKFLSLSDIRNFLIPIPPIELQNKFAERIEKIEKLKFEIEKSIETAQNLYDSLISKYFDN